MENGFPKTLLNRNLYPHTIEQFQIIETHLSWVILTGKFAYKIKKPLNLGFQDYTTLENRKKYYELELQLNKRTAPGIYQHIVPITGTHENPEFNGKGPIIEYAIVMKEFPQGSLLSNLAKNNLLNTDTISKLSSIIAQFHQSIETCPQSYIYGTPENILQPILDNFTQLKESKDPKVLDTIQQIEDWNNMAYPSLKPILETRKRDGFIKACHGDLHLGNIVLIENNPVLFDCIEFNESFRWIDVLNDLAFLCMDLEHFNLPHFGGILLNLYLEKTLDYEHLNLFRFYQCYRAVVRAKIAYLQMLQTPENAKAINLDLNKFLSLSSSYIQKRTPKLVLTHGFSGSGKTLYTQTLLTDCNTIRLRSDVIRLNMLSKIHDQTQRYSNESTEQVYNILAHYAKNLIQAGFDVIIDATFLKAKFRSQFFEIANTLNCHIEIFAFEASLPTLKTRIKQRISKGYDLSEADADVLKLQIDQYEPLSDFEKNFAITINETTITKLIN